MICQDLSLMYIVSHSENLEKFQIKHLRQWIFQDLLYRLSNDFNILFSL